MIFDTLTSYSIIHKDGGAAAVPCDYLGCKKETLNISYKSCLRYNDKNTIWEE